MDLQTNAIESIQAGVEDYSAATRPRLLSAVRNIHAGILLLYKEALRRRSPPDSDEALVKARLRPVNAADGSVRFVGVGKRTVDTQAIRERFESLGVQTDWNRFSRIADIRNDIEHYYPSVSQDSLREMVASAFWIVRAFVTDELAGDPKVLLGIGTWATMLGVAEIYEAERSACDKALAEASWDSEALSAGLREFRCDDCASSLWRPVDPTADLEDMELVCAGCGAKKKADDFVPAAIAATFHFEMYLAAKEGSDEPYVDCPECGQAAYVVSEGRCARCGESAAASDCERCGNPIPASELEFAPLCAYCAYVMSKDE